jgi:hypothetical protein
MKLKHEVETVYSVEYRDLEEFIEKHTGHRYEVVQATETGNDSTVRTSVPEQIDPDDYLMTEIKEFNIKGWEGGWMDPSVPLAALRLKGLVEPGTYLIHICW